VSAAVLLPAVDGFRTREEWLTAASAIISPEVGAPPSYVSVGFPKGRSGKRRAIGQCWDGRLSQDGRAHMFICPTLAEPVEVLAVLAHELCHAATPGKGHKKPFIELARAFGLVKPWTATTPGPECAARLAHLANTLGAFPHAPLALVEKKKQTSRMRLWECACEPVVKVRCASDDFDATCNVCESPFAIKSRV
jgi:hypothetical protein